MGLYLFRDEQQDALEELVTEESSDGYVEEESVQHRARDVGQRLRQQEHGQTDEHVRQDPGYPRLSNMHHTERIFEHSREGHENARQSNSLIFNMVTRLELKCFLLAVSSRLHGLICDCAVSGAPLYNRE